MSDVKLSVILIKNTTSEELDCCIEAIQTATAGMDTELQVTEVFTGKEEEIIRQTTGEYILCMDSRVWPGEDIFRTLCFFMDEHPEAGMAGIKLIDGHGTYLPESKRTFPSVWKRLFYKAGIGSLTGFAGGHMDKECSCGLPSGSFYIFRRETWDKVHTHTSIYTPYSYDLRLADQLLANGFKNYFLPERALYMREGQTVYKPKHPRMLVIGYEKEFETVKKVLSRRMPQLEFINLWDLDNDRIMEAICRKNKMKNFTDITFMRPNIRMEQILLFIEKMPEKTTSYHFYHTKKNTFITLVR